MAWWMETITVTHPSVLQRERVKIPGPNKILVVVPRFLQAPFAKSGGAVGRLLVLGGRLRGGMRTPNWNLAKMSLAKVHIHIICCCFPCSLSDDALAQTGSNSACGCACSVEGSELPKLFWRLYRCQVSSSPSFAKVRLFLADPAPSLAYLGVPNPPVKHFGSNAEGHSNFIKFYAG